MRPPILIAAAGILMLPAQAAAQWLAPGQRIRVTAPQLSLEWQAGQLQWLDRDSLVLADGPQRWVVPRSLLMQLDSSTGKRGHPVTGVAVGAAVGLLVGAILFAPSSPSCKGSGNYGQVCGLARAGIAIGGAGLGALVGTATRTEQWAAVPLDSLRFNPGPPRPRP